MQMTFEVCNITRLKIGLMVFGLIFGDVFIITQSIMKKRDRKMALVELRNTETGKWETIDITDEQLNAFNRMNEEIIPQSKIKTYIDNLDISPEFKAMLYKLVDATIKIGDKISYIGRKIVEVIVYLTKQFPNTAMGAIVGFVIGTLIASIPVVGWIVGPFAIAAGTAIGAATGFSYDITDKMTKQTVNEYLNEMFGVFKDMKMKV